MTVAHGALANRPEQQRPTFGYPIAWSVAFTTKAAVIRLLLSIDEKLGPSAPPTHAECPRKVRRCLRGGVVI